MLEGLFFRPNQIKYQTPEIHPFGYSEHRIPRRSDGHLHAYLFNPPDSRKSNYCVIHLHGNFGNITHHFPCQLWLTQLGLQVLSFDYSGFGESSGKASARQAKQDVEDVWNWSLKHFGHKKKMILFGQSLGGFLLIHSLAGIYPRQKVAAVIVEGGFYSFCEMIRLYASMLPLVKFFAAPLSMLADVELAAKLPEKGRFPFPFLHIHGDFDRTVPLEQGRRIFEKLPAKVDKTWWEVPGGEHLDTFSSHDYSYRRSLADFLASHLSSFKLPAKYQAASAPQDLLS